MNIKEGAIIMKKCKQEQVNRKCSVLQNHLDELTAYFIKDTGKTPGKTTILELMEWIAQQSEHGGLKHGM